MGSCKDSHSLRRAARGAVAVVGLGLGLGLGGVGAAHAGPGDAPVATGARPPLEVAARATLDRWLAAQNKGRFADYAALYAPSFTGVKRVGATTKQMTRAAWLKDRKAMFRARLDVTAKDVHVTLPANGGGGPVLDFTQTWASGAFADVGPKRIVLDAAGALIVSEELLSSRPVLTEQACLTAVYPGASMKRKHTGPGDGNRPVLGIAVRDLGARWACKIMIRESEHKQDVTIGVLAFGTKWRVKGLTWLSVDEFPPEDEGGETVSGDVDLEPIALKDGVPTLEVVQEHTISGPEYAKREITTTIYRVDGDELAELLSWDEGGTTGEADDVERCDLEVGTRRRDGWPDLTLVCTTTQIAWAAGEQEPKETTARTTYVWDGSAYSKP